MSDVVIDSCVLAKVVLTEPDSPKALALLANSLAQGDRLVVLDLAFPEVGNVIWKKRRAGLVTSQEAEKLLEDLLCSPVHIEPALPHLRRALEIAVRYDRAVYDALFVALSEWLSAEAVTSDGPLFNTVSGDFPLVRLLAGI